MVLTPTWWKADSDLYGGFSGKYSFLVCSRFFVRSGKAVLRPVACDQDRGARGRGQGETVAKLGGLPPSVACVSQRLAGWARGATMNGETGFLHSVGFWSVPVCRFVEDPRGARHCSAS